MGVEQIGQFGRIRKKKKKEKREEEKKEGRRREREREKGKRGFSFISKIYGNRAVGFRRSKR